MKNENQLADVLICVAIKRGGGFVQDQKFAPSDNKITIIDRFYCLKMIPNNHNDGYDTNLRTALARQTSCR